MWLLPDDSQIYISGLYISGFSLYNMSRNACKIISGAPEILKYLLVPH
jgi:hypothetical protein